MSVQKLSTHPAFLSVCCIVIFGFFVRLGGMLYGLPNESLSLRTYHSEESQSFDALAKWDALKLRFDSGNIVKWGGFHLYPLALAIKAGEKLGTVRVESRDYYQNHLHEADKLYLIARMLQVLCGTMSVLLVFLIANESFGPRAGLLSAFLLAVAPVAVVNSTIVRPDAMTTLLTLCSLYCSLKIWNHAGAKLSVLSGIFLGLATATEYRAAAFAMFPALNHMLSHSPGNRKNLIYFFAAAITIFAMASSALFFNFSAAASQLLDQLRAMNAPFSSEDHAPGAWNALRRLLPLGLGAPLTIAGIAGWSEMVYQWTVRKNFPQTSIESPRFFTILWTVASFFIFVMLSFSAGQQTWSVQLYAPLFIIFAGYLFSKLTRSSIKRNKIIASALLTGVLGCTTAYGFSRTYLLLIPNTRKIASDWILKNIAKGESIGVARVSYWTPPVLKQYRPPYDILEGGGPQVSLENCVQDLKKFKSEVHYLVLSEYEYRLIQKPDEELKGFTEIARFEQNDKILNALPPRVKNQTDDWIALHPKIRIYKRI